MESGSGAVLIRRFTKNLRRENEGNTERLTNVLKQMFALISQDFKENEGNKEKQIKKKYRHLMVQVVEAD